VMNTFLPATRPGIRVSFRRAFSSPRERGEEI
jgi:hypothetical protein